MLSRKQMQESNRLVKLADAWLAGKKPRPTINPVVDDCDTELFTVTTEWIKANATPAGGYKAAQVKLIGVKYPLPHKWMQKSEGRKITQDARKAFEAFHAGFKATAKSKAAMRQQKDAPAKADDLSLPSSWPTIIQFTPEQQTCNCNVLPWEDCEHTELAAHAAMMEMMA